MVTKVAFVCETTHLGGLEKHALNILRDITDGDIEKHVIITDMAGILNDQFKEHSDRYQNIQYLNDPNRLFTLHRPPPTNQALAYLHNYIELHDIDVVHLFNGIQYVVGIPDNLPLILQLGGDYDRDVYYARITPEMVDWNELDPKTIRRRITNHVNNRPKTLIVTDKESNLDIFTKNSVFQKNYVPEVAISGVPKKNRTIIWVGRDSHEKHPEILVKVAKALPSYDFALIMASETDKIVNIAESLPDNVDLYFNMPDMYQIATLYERASIVLNTSDTEGIPLSISEAHSHGCFSIGPPVLHGLVNHCVSDWEEIEEYTGAIKGFTGLPQAKKDWYNEQNRKKSSPETDALQIKSIIRRYKEISNGKS